MPGDEDACTVFFKCKPSLPSFAPPPSQTCELIIFDLFNYYYYVIFFPIFSAFFFYCIGDQF